MWLYFAGEAEMSKWVETAAELRVEAERHREARDQAKKEAAKSQEIMASVEAQADAKEEEIVALKRKLHKSSQIPPEAVPYVAPVQAVSDAQGKQIDLLKAGLAACKETVANKDKVILESDTAGDLSEKQAVGWKDFSRKQKRKYRMKMAFTNIGAGVLGGIGGYYTGRASK